MHGLPVGIGAGMALSNEKWLLCVMCAMYFSINKKKMCVYIYVGLE